MSELMTDQAQQKRILIMAGGTGGHVFPALAVAKYLSQQGWKVRWWLCQRPRRSCCKIIRHPISFA